jgi:hypothetical protein
MKRYLLYLLISAGVCLGAIVVRVTLLYYDGKAARDIYPVRAQCRNIEDAVSLYKGMHGSYPSEKDALPILFNDENCRKLLKSTNVYDPWGTRYRFRVVDGRPLVDSAGRDREFDTMDDVHGF